MVTGLCACGLGRHHVWTEATCTTPKTCMECGKTEGSVNPNAHSTKSGQCEYCGDFVLILN